MNIRIEQLEIRIEHIKNPCLAEVQIEQLLELTFLVVFSFPRLSMGSVSSSKRKAELHCSEAELERLSTFDVKFSINLKISLWPNLVSLKRLDKRFSILLEISSKSCSERLTFSSFEWLQFSISFWLVLWSVLNFLFCDFSGIFSRMYIRLEKLN